jgi:hypothetical protein
MKKFLFTFIFSAFGSLAGSYLYSIGSDANVDFSWERAVYFGIFFGVTMLIWARLKKA